MRLCLASASLRRLSLIKLLGIEPTICPSTVDETPLAHELPVALAQRLARLKAMQVAATLGFNEVDAVLGADTVVALGNKLFGKPASRSEAIEILMELSGKTHEVITAVCICTATQTKEFHTVSRVTFGLMTQEDCAAYWNVGESIDKAGGYAIQGAAQMFIERLQGSYTGVVGLPLYETRCALRTLGL